ncbi:MAG: ASKHA domain-containing protein [Kiritimatiellae bacterium]|jgi:uncharacterized 2Fe-2S/4Fe-4S cluster protein (DUF4445 family)|nr:ASKHA domain-containing protein [Kiritimatiellia bacterium]
MSEKISVKFLPSGKTVLVPKDCTVLQAVRVAGLWIESPCNGNQICGKCRVRILEGKVHSSGAAQGISSSELMNGWRLACSTKIFEPVTVEIPQVSSDHVLSKILVDGAEIQLRHDQRNKGHLGIAFDLGTTSVVATLFDLYSGEERESAVTHNRQISYGDDVISRINHVRENSGGLAALQEAVLRTLNRLILILCRSCDEKVSSVFHIAVAGNTTMQQILIGIDPSPLGEYPFEPAFKEAQYLSAPSIGFKAAPSAELVVFPQVGGFVGGDTIAGLLAAGFDNLKAPSLFVDIGTNGEIALFNRSKIYTASTAAGPAFEGARIRHGMRAKEGAIDQIWMVGEKLHFHTIGDVESCGLCGSALIDCVALLLENGVVDATGRMEVSESAPAALVSRVFEGPEKQPAFALTYNKDNEPNVYLTQRDVRELQLASGTIRAGIETLLHLAGLRCTDLDGISLAGGFGNYIRREKALLIGLLPPVHYMKIRFIGNAALTGAKRGLLARAEMNRAGNILKMTEHVDLSTQPKFSELFMEHMMFPE